MNYCGIVAKIGKTEEITGANSIQVAYVLGEPIIVSKGVKVGNVGIFFPPDTQLSKEYLSTNNLYRNSDLNEDKTQSGFFEENGRVRAQPFMKVKSCGYFAGLESLDFIPSLPKLEVGMMFEEINKVPVAKKYVNPNIKMKHGNKNTKARKKIETPLFHEHVDTDQFKYHADRIQAGTIISIQAKAHGTSGRASNTLVKKALPKWKEWVNSVLPVFKSESWELITGTRRVVLKNIDKDKDGFHGSEAFRFEVLEELKPHLEKGDSVYFEIIGNVNGKGVMPAHDVTKLKDKAMTKKYGKTIEYSYGCLPEEYKFFIYRVSKTNLDGTEVDLTQPQMKAWCENRGLNSTFDVVDPFVYDGDVEKLKELVESLTEREEYMTEDYRSPNQISEGVVVRVDGDGLIPKFYKSKSTAFRIMENICKEVTEEDLQSVGS